MSKHLSLFPVIIWVVCGLIYISFALDYRMHWDEPSYLYTGAFLTFDEIIEGDFQPSGFHGFYISRIFHVLLVHTIFAIIGPGKIGLFAVIMIYFMILFGSTFMIYQILKILIGSSEGLSDSLLIYLFTPLYLYLSFKTLPEIPALFCSTFSIWAFIKYLQKNSISYLIIVAIFLTFTAFFKNLLILQFLSFLVVLFVFNASNFGRKNILLKSIYAGTLFLAFFFLLFVVMDISLNDYIGDLPGVMKETEPFSAIILHILLAGGIFYLTIPLAFLTKNSTNSKFYCTWFLFSFLRILFITRSIEARYFTGSMIPMAGLIHLSYSHIQSTVKEHWRKNRKTKVFGMIAVLISGIVLLSPIHTSIMAHELKISNIDKLIKILDTRFSKGQYTILIPWEYVDFHYFRLVYPERSIKNVYSIKKNIKIKKNVKWIHFQKKYYGEDLIYSLEKLEKIAGPLIYIGFNENPAVNNLRKIVQKLPFPILHKQFENLSFVNHLELSWMWQNSSIEFKQIAVQGQYHAYLISLN